jgi:hypothetical protein
VEVTLSLITMYAGPIGAPLYCSTPDSPLAFSPSTQPWIAIPVEQFKSEQAVCGDLYYLRIYLLDGSTRSLMARAYDAGPFSRFCVVQSDGSCPSIAADIPAYWWPVDVVYTTSAWAEIYPISRWAREWRETGVCGWLDVGDTSCPVRRESRGKRLYD